MNTIDLYEFARLGVATVYEASGRAGLVDLPLHQLTPGSRVAGPACTVRCEQGDNLMVHAAMAAVRPGEVLVITMPEAEPVALVGELLATQALAQGATAMLIDAAVRDAEELRTLGLPIWARFIRVRGATRTAVGEINTPVTMGGATIRHGDIIVLDGDGAVVVAAERAAEVLAAAQAREAREASNRSKFQAGELSIDLYNLRQQVASQLTPGRDG